MTNVCVGGGQGQMFFPLGGSCASGQTSFTVDDPANLLPTCYLVSNGAIRKVSSSTDCSQAPRSKKEAFLLVPSLTTDLYFCADNTTGALYFQGTSAVNCGAKKFLVVVKQANHPPVANAQSVSLNEDTTTLITLTGSDPDGQPITFKVTSLPTNGDLFKGNSTAAADKITSASLPLTLAGAQVTYKPNANYFGSDSFQFKTNDGFTDSTAAAAVSITVVGVNDAPSFTKGSDQTVLEDGGPQAVPSWASNISAGPGESQVLNFVVSNDNNPLFSAQPAISPAGTLTYTPAPNANGSATVSVTLHDDGGTANGGVDTSASQTFTISVTSVNDPPSFTKGADPTVLEDAGPQTVNPWATAISPGPADEAGQTVQFNITSNTNTALFSAGPSVAANGTLTYTPAANANGDATITVVAQDNGGTANGGSDTSTPQTFKITVTAVNDAPSFNTLAGSPPTVNEDALSQTVPGFATGMSAGPANESSQTVHFVVTNNSNTGLFDGIAGQPLLDATTGNLTYTPAPNANGTATITIDLMDNGGTANGGVDTSPTQSFTITVTAVNDPPTFTKGPDQSVLEDSGAQTVNPWATGIGPGGGADEAGQAVSFSVTGNTNPGLFSAGPSISSSGVLSYTTAANANGDATITVVAQDNGGTANGGSDTSAPQAFKITVTAVNDAPSFDLPASPDQTVVEDSGSHTVSGFATNISAGPVNESGQTLTFHTSNDNTALFSTQPSINASNGDLTFQSASGATGSAIVSVYLMDNGGTANGGVDTSTTKTFKITVTPPNAAPVAQSQTGANAVQGVEDMVEQVTLSATDGDGDSLTFSIVSPPSKGSLSNFGSVSCIGVPSTCTQTVDYTSSANLNGTDSFTFKANDGKADSNVATIEIDIAAINDAPSFTKGADQTVLEDAGAQSVPNWATAISAGPADESGQTVTFQVTNNTNAALFSTQPAVSSTGTLTYTPAANAFGSATITLVAKDDGGTANGGTDTSAPQTFQINVTGVNDAPSFTKGADQTALEDSGAHTVAGWATGISAGPNESGQTVSFEITSNTNPTLFSAGPSVSSSGDLSFTSAANANGTATITLVAKDDGGTANGGVDTSAPQSFMITITAVNDAPSFTKGADQTALEDSGAQTANGWATSISAGPPDESGQTVTFHVANDNNALFAVQPSLTAGGDLSYTPAANANGSANVSVTLSDDGGTANGGVDTSAPQTFKIDVTAVNDPPSFTKGGNQTVDEDSGAQTVNPWATAISAGPTNESSQTVSFVITGNTKPGLFSAGPSVSSSGVLTFTPAANQNGTATITVVAQDNGGTANGGNDTSAPQTFTITVNAINDPPTSPGRDYGTNSLQANMQRAIAAASGLLFGAADAADVAGNPSYTPTFTVGTVNGVAPVAGTINTTIAGVGKITVNASTGAFEIDPAPGVTGNVSFSYTVCDNGDGTPASQCSAPATASFNIAGPVIWFVDPTNGLDTNRGTLVSPFKTITQAATVDASGQRIFVYSGGTATGAITLNSDEWVIGQASTTAFDTLFAISPPSGTTARPAMNTGTTTLGDTITLAANAKLQGLSLATTTATGITGSGGLTGVSVSESSITTTTGTALNLNNVAGTMTFSSISKNGTGGGISLVGTHPTLTISGGAIQSTTTAAVSINGGTADFSDGGTITNSAGASVSVQSHTGGTVTFSGAISDSGTGIFLNGNTGGTITFSGTLTLSTGANTAFNVAGGGTVNVINSNNTVSTSTGTALDVENTTIGASNLTFQSISANGGSHGIVLLNTGASGHLTVTGTGLPGSGGSITGITGADLATNNCGDLGSTAPVGVGVYLKSTSSPSFSYMTFPGTFGNFGILGYNVDGFTLDHTTMTGTYGDNVNVDDDTVHFCTLTGSASISNDTIANGAESNLRIVNASGTLNRLTLTNDTIGLNQTNGGGGTLFESDNSGTVFNATVEDTTFDGSRGSPFQAAPQAGTTMDLVFGAPGHGNTVHNTHGNIVPFAQDALFTAGGTFTFDINSNHFDSAAAVQAQGGVFINAANSTAVASGYFRNNTIGNSGVANSGSSGNDPGLDVESNGGGDLTIKIDNNQMYQWGSNGAGFLLQAGATGGNPTAVNATVTNNTIAQPGTFAVANNAQGFQLNNGTNSGENFTTCLAFSGNVFDQAGTGTGGDGRFRQRFDTKVLMPGYTGAADGTTGSPTVASYIQGLNPTGPPTITSVSSTAGGGGFFNTPGPGNACAVPGF
jgi:large repetitive protein